MALTQYRKKRSFSRTPEPEGGKGDDKTLRFVVQKHAASRLHYDFRLEMEGVLKSWAVPKGPSLDPGMKRLAMMVEDHPYDYRNFEGIIPEGNYGAGAVIIWDEGTYTPVEDMASKKKQENFLLKQLQAGSLKIRLNGKKLKGEFALVHTRGRGDNSWLLIKHRDRYATTKDITEKGRSVVSGKTIEKMAVTARRTWESDRKTGATRKSPKTGRTAITPKKGRAAGTAKTGVATNPPKKSAVIPKKGNAAGAAKNDATTGSRHKAGDEPVVRTARENGKRHAGDSFKKRPVSGLKAAIKTPFPHSISPMLATLVDKPFDESGWLYEIKWDGYRALMLSHRSEVNLLSRNQKVFNEKFYPVYEAVKEWGIEAVVDGEIVVLDQKGISRFGALQNWRSEADGNLVYYVFDLLWLDGYSLTAAPLSQRRELLRTQLPAADGPIRMSEDFTASASDFIEAAKQMGLEGFIAKKADSTYSPGMRTRDWLKVKVNKRHEVVIGGFTRNGGTSKTFSSLLVGVYENGSLEYTGKIGTGFTARQQQYLMEKFKPLITDRVPFSSHPDVNKPSRFRPAPPHAAVFWLEPELVCEVHYAEITADGVMRHPSFEGLREDKKPETVSREEPVKINQVMATKKKATRKKIAPSVAQKILRSAAKNSQRNTLLNPSEKTQVRKVGGYEIKFTNLDKVFWPKEGYTKRDLLNYYYGVVPFLLPHLQERPQSLNRYPNGIRGKSFFQKDVTGKAPDWIELFPYTTNEGEDKNYMLCNKEADLLYMVNLGCIEIHPWSSTRKKPQHPDWCLIDLDPGSKSTFEDVIEVAQAVKKVLDEIGINGYCKTSGSTGMHIYIPLLPKYSYDECQLLGRWIATEVNEQMPGITSIERTVKNRSGKLYIDFLQNRPGATLAAPYSVRPRPGATVSMPLHWEEVKKGLSLQDFTIRNALKRLNKEGDLFKPVLTEGTDLKKVLRSLE